MRRFVYSKQFFHSEITQAFKYLKKRGFTIVIEEIDKISSSSGVLNVKVHVSRTRIAKRTQQQQD